MIFKNPFSFSTPGGIRIITLESFGVIVLSGEGVEIAVGILAYEIVSLGGEIEEDGGENGLNDEGLAFFAENLLGLEFTMCVINKAESPSGGWVWENILAFEELLIFVFF